LRGCLGQAVQGASNEGAADGGLVLELAQERRVHEVGAVVHLQVEEPVPDRAADAFGLEGEVGRAFEADPDDLALAANAPRRSRRPRSSWIAAFMRSIVTCESVRVFQGLRSSETFPPERVPGAGGGGRLAELPPLEGSGIDGDRAPFTHLDEVVVVPRASN